MCVILVMNQNRHLHQHPNKIVQIRDLSVGY